MKHVARNEEIYERRQQGDTFAAIGKSFNLSGGMISIIVRKTEWDKREWGDNIPLRGVVRAVGKAAKEEGLTTNDWIDEDEFREFIPKMSCLQIAGCRSNGARALAGTMEWCIFEGVELACGCPGDCDFARTDEDRRTIQEKIYRHEGELKILKQQLKDLKR